jgi:hypothetical protein
MRFGVLALEPTPISYFYFPCSIRSSSGTATHSFNTV